MADTLVLEASAVRREGSSPFPGTTARTKLAHIPTILNTRNPRRGYSRVYDRENLSQFGSCGFRVDEIGPYSHDPKDILGIRR
jgi:hypothetical protein